MFRQSRCCQDRDRLKIKDRWPANQALFTPVQYFETASNQATKMPERSSYDLQEHRTLVNGFGLYPIDIWREIFDRLQPTNALVSSCRGVCIAWLRLCDEVTSKMFVHCSKVCFEFYILHCSCATVATQYRSLYLYQFFLRCKTLVKYNRWFYQASVSTSWYRHLLQAAFWYPI